MCLDRVSVGAKLGEQRSLVVRARREAAHEERDARPVVAQQIADLVPVLDRVVVEPAVGTLNRIAWPVDHGTWVAGSPRANW